MTQILKCKITTETYRNGAQVQQACHVKKFLYMYFHLFTNI